MTWKPHIESCQQKGVIRTRLLRRLAGIKWGVDSVLERLTQDMLDQSWNMVSLLGAQQPGVTYKK